MTKRKEKSDHKIPKAPPMTKAERAKLPKPKLKVMVLRNGKTRMEEYDA